MLENVRDNKHIFYFSYKTIRRISDPTIKKYFNAIRLLRKDVEYMVDISNKIYKQIGVTHTNSIPQSACSASTYFDIFYGLRKRLYEAYSNLSLPDEELRREAISRHIDAEEKFTLSYNSHFEEKRIFVVAVLTYNNGSIKVMGRI